MLVLIIVVVLVSVGVVAAIGYALGLFRIEKVEVKDQRVDLSLPGSEEQEKPEYDLDDGVSLKEKMDLTGILGDHGADEKSASQTNESEDDGQYDRLSEFKTGRGYLIDCQRMLTTAKTADEMYAVAWFDIDRFRFINSLKGMSIGDYVLTRMGHELRSAFPEGCNLTRISADHFVAAFPLSSVDLLEVCADQLREVCEKIRGDIVIKSGLRICMGVAVAGYNDRDYDISVMLQKANIARHCTKSSRSENWKLYDDSMVSTWLYGESALEDYNENQYSEEFVIYFAPQQNLLMRNLTGAEAYVRWACEENTLKLPPSDKVKIPTNSAKVIYQVCKSMSRWRKAGKQVLPVSVSIPATELCKQDLHEFLHRCLAEFQLNASELAIVVEASMVRMSWSAVSRQFKKLQEIGVRTGVDEIDTGYRDLEFLSGLPLNFIKFHRSFVAGIQNGEEGKEAVRRMFNAAGKLNARAIFEGVNTPDQVNVLLELGVHDIQGNFGGRPQPTEEFLQVLSESVESQYRKGTVILDEAALKQGDYNVF